MSKIYDNIVVKPIDDIRPFIGSHNTDEAVEMIAKSINMFGLQQPIVIDKGGNIVAGNSIWKAAKELGISEVPTLCVDELSEEEVAQYRIADNKTSEFARWNEGKLKKELTYMANPTALQSFFDEDISKLVSFEAPHPSKPYPKTVESPATGESVRVINESDINKHQDTQDFDNTPAPRPEYTEEEVRKFIDGLKQKESEQSVKPTEYFTFTCSKCGKQVTIRKTW